MTKFPLRRFANYILPRPSTFLRELNSNALMTEWAKLNRTTKIFKHRFDLYEFINSSVVESNPIDFFEFGVYKGTSLFKWAELNADVGSRFYGFDSFEGLPEAWDRVRKVKKQGHFDVGGQIPDTADHRIRFVKGLFQRSLPPFIADFVPRNRLIVHHDSDLYSSTLYCLTKLDAILREGSIVIFDEFYSSSHEFQAFADYSKAYQRRHHVLGAVGINPYLQIAIMLD